MERASLGRYVVFVHHILHMKELSDNIIISFSTSQKDKMYILSKSLMIHNEERKHKLPCLISHFPS